MRKVLIIGALALAAVFASCNRNVCPGVGQVEAPQKVHG